MTRIRMHYRRTNLGRLLLFSRLRIPSVKVTNDQVSVRPHSPEGHLFKFRLQGLLTIFQLWYCSTSKLIIGGTHQVVLYRFRQGTSPGDRILALMEE
ncbi:hypothetical protein OG21DRAFT_782581 [Imleria badia]|nr:hypothetical protein OG21DRAFT_782581 [Imleria badia]